MDPKIEVKKKREPMPPKGTDEYRLEINRRSKERYKNKVANMPPRVKKEKEPTYLESKPPNFLPNLKHLIVAMPPKMVPIFGKTYTMNNDQATWYFFHSKRLDTLSETTQKQYKLMVNRLLKISNDMYERIYYVLTQPVATKAQFIKAWLNHLGGAVYDVYAKPEPLKTIKSYEELVLEMFLYAELSKRSKVEVNNLQMGQLASEERIDNTVEWDEWVSNAKKYVDAYFYKKDATVEELTNMAMIALYCYLPPIRLDYDDVLVVKKMTKALKTAKNNVLVLTGPVASGFHWYKFKNASAFEKEGTLPVMQSLPKKLILILKKYWTAVGSSTRTKLFEVPHFGQELSAIAKIITGKNFTNRLMRSSFIQDFYAKVQEGKMDLDDIQAMMRSIHQTNIEVNLSYIKKLAEDGVVD